MPAREPRWFHWTCRKCGCKWRARIPEMPGSPQRPDEKSDTICLGCAELICSGKPIVPCKNTVEVET